MEKTFSGEMVQWFRALATLTEDLGWFLALLSGNSQLCVTSVSGDLVPSSGLCGYLHAGGTHADKLVHNQAINQSIIEDIKMGEAHM